MRDEVLTLREFHNRGIKQNHKLSKKDVEEIREKFANGVAIKVIAIDYNISERMACRIKEGYKWKWEQ